MNVPRTFPSAPNKRERYELLMRDIDPASAGQLTGIALRISTLITKRNMKGITTRLQIYTSGANFPDKELESHVNKITNRGRIRPLR